MDVPKPLSAAAVLCLALVLSIGCRKQLKTPDPLANGNITTSNATAAVITRQYYILPKTTDTSITTALSSHFVSVQEGGVLKNVLYVFLPGTYRNPARCLATTKKAASLGYHSIGLMYDNSVRGNPTCSPTGDITCHSRLRLEVIDGIDRHPSVAVNRSNSLINRLTKLLMYLHKTYPAQNWSQYLVNGKPNWSKIIIAGHSQGGAIAGVIGKHYPVKKVIMISMIDFLNNGKMPDWQTSQVNKEKYYALTNTSDELVSWPRVKAGWVSLGMTGFGPVINVDWNPFPYKNSHTLVTTILPKTTWIDKYHNSTAVDSYIPKNAAGQYIYDKAWEYMLNN